jgi:hypothetical protein
VTLTVNCLVSNCAGSYTGTVRILQGYSIIPPDLPVTITVT